MNVDLILNIIGYIGSALVLMSFLMASVLKLRLVNIAGSVASVIYSLLIKAYPTLVMNAALIVINVYYIVKMLKQKNIYHVVETKQTDTHLGYFLNYYKDDIDIYFPEFKKENNYDVIKFLYCENIPASVFIAKKIDNNTLEVILDYATPEYRDCSAGKYIYETLAKENIHKVILKSKTFKHEKYLAKVGFVNKGNEYEKNL